LVHFAAGQAGYDHVCAQFMQTAGGAGAQEVLKGAGLFNHQQDAWSGGMHGMPFME
jgi:hypothetical protein